MVSFAIQNLLSRSHLFIFGFIFITPGGISKMTHCCDICQSVLLIFSFKSFIVFDLTCRSLIHFELFLCMVLGNVLI